jgi:hypothetical protein
MYAYIVRYAFILVANASSEMVLPTAGQRLANVQALPMSLHVSGGGARQ